MLWTLFLLHNQKGGKGLNSIFQYAENNGEVIITGLQEDVSDTSIVIPETIDGMPVTEIYGYAFCESPITDIKIGANIRKIGDEAFYSCEKLSSVIWNHKCDVIPDFCFAGCLNLTQFDLSGIKKVGTSAFVKSGLTSVTLSKGTTVNQNCFAFCKSLAKVEWLSARSIKGDIFKGCEDIKEIFISDNVKNIEASAFASSPNAEITFI